MSKCISNCYTCKFSKIITEENKQKIFCCFMNMKNSFFNELLKSKNCTICIDYIPKSPINMNVKYEEKY